MREKQNPRKKKKTDSYKNLGTTTIRFSPIPYSFVFDGIAFLFIRLVYLLLNYVTNALTSSLLYSTLFLIKPYLGYDLYTLGINYIYDPICFLGLRSVAMLAILRQPLLSFANCHLHGCFEARGATTLGGRCTLICLLRKIIGRFLRTRQTLHI